MRSENLAALRAELPERSAPTSDAQTDLLSEPGSENGNAAALDPVQLASNRASAFAPPVALTAASTVLAVFDLDGTISRGDTLLPFLRFFAGTRGFLLGLVRALPALVGFTLGLISRDAAKEAVLRAFLGGIHRMELQGRGEAFARERLPVMVRREAQERLAWHKARGHRCVLLTASVDVYVEPWARALGFDDVLATRLQYDESGRFTGRFDGDNCRGEAKLRRLEAQFGDLAALKIFGYGDSPADRAFLARCTEASYKPFAGSAPTMRAVRTTALDLVRLMRPHQWIKNGFVFVGLLFGHAWSDPTMAAAAVLAALAFCLFSSAIYIVNDFADRERDRGHPQKRHRPLASGRVSAGAALALAGGLAAAGSAVAFAVGAMVLAVVAVYAAMNLAYSFGLKNVVILDAFIIAAGFLLRILAGTLGIGIDPSQWLLVCGLFLTLFLGFTKRRSERLSLSGDQLLQHRGRKVLLHYDAALLDKFIGICAAGAILSYSLYTMSPDTARIHGTANLIYTIPFVIYGIFRYLYLLHAKRAGSDTSRDLVRDGHLATAVVGWGLATFLLISGGST
jgi:HAD superfamily hydrolase (TIGR01490 family)